MERAIPEGSRRSRAARLGGGASARPAWAAAGRAMAGLGVGWLMPALLHYSIIDSTGALRVLPISTGDPGLTLSGEF